MCILSTTYVRVSTELINDNKGQYFVSYDFCKLLLLLLLLLQHIYRLLNITTEIAEILLYKLNRHFTWYELIGWIRAYKKYYHNGFSPFNQSIYIMWSYISVSIIKPINFVLHNNISIFYVTIYVKLII